LRIELPMRCTIERSGIVLALYQGSTGRAFMSRSTIIALVLATVLTVVGAAASAIAVRSEPAPISVPNEIVAQTAPRKAPSVRVTKHTSRRHQRDREATNSRVYSTRAAGIARSL